MRGATAWTTVAFFLEVCSSQQSEPERGVPFLLYLTLRLIFLHADPTVSPAAPGKNTPRFRPINCHNPFSTRVEMGVGKKLEGGGQGLGRTAVSPAWRSAKLELVHADGWARDGPMENLKVSLRVSMHQAERSLTKPNSTHRGVPVPTWTGRRAKLMLADR